MDRFQVPSRCLLPACRRWRLLAERMHLNWRYTCNNGRRFPDTRQSNKILDSCYAGCGRQALWGTTNTIRFSQNNCKSSVFCYPVTGFHTTNMAHVRPVYWSGWRICCPVANRTSRIVFTCFSLPSTIVNTFWGKPVWLARSQPGDLIQNDINVLSHHYLARPPCWYHWQHVPRSPTTCCTNSGQCL